MNTYAHVSRISGNPGNIRDDLGDLAEMTESIRALGIQQPLIVRRHPDDPGRYEVIDGHRRLEAAKAAGLQQVPVMLSKATPLAVMLVTACHRADLSPVEKARAMQRLRSEEGYSAARIAKETGISPATVSYYLTLTELDEGTQARVAAGTVKVKDAMAAVRQTRARQAKAKGHRPQGPRPKITVAAPHFCVGHPLAEDARIRCELAGHTGPKVGSTKGSWPGACGECWEAEIRADERVRSRSARTGGGIAFRAPQMEVAGRG